MSKYEYVISSDQYDAELNRIFGDSESSAEQIKRRAMLSGVAQMVAGGMSVPEALVAWTEATERHDRKMAREGGIMSNSDSREAYTRGALSVARQETTAAALFA